MKKYMYPKGPASDMTPDSIVQLVDDYGVTDAYVGELAYGDVYYLRDEQSPIDCLDLIIENQIEIWFLSSGNCCLKGDGFSVTIEEPVTAGKVRSALCRWIGRGER